MSYDGIWQLGKEHCLRGTRGVIEYGAGGSDVVGTLVLMMLMVKRGHRLHHHHPTGSG